MMDASARELTPADLSLLGHFYQNDFPLLLKACSHGVEIVPPQSTWKSMVVMTSLIGLVYAGFVWVAIANDVGDKLGPVIWLLLLLI